MFWISSLYLILVLILAGCDLPRSEEVRERWPGGQKRLVAVYRHDAETAEIEKLKEYDETGDLVRETIYLQGGTIEVRKLALGRILESRVYKDSILVEINNTIARRVVLETWDNGSPKVEIIYIGEGSDEEVFERTRFLEDGRLLKYERLDLNEKREYFYTDDGDLKGERSYREGKLVAVDGFQATEVTESTWPDGSQRKVAVYITKDNQEVLFESVELAKDGQPLMFEVPGEEYERWFTYHPDGSLESEVEFRGGKKSGFQRFFDAEGALLVSYQYLHGKLHGTCTEFYPNGENKFTETWKDSLLISGSYFKPDAGLSSVIVEGEGEKTIYYDEGSKQSTAEYRNGVRNGYFTIWNTKGVKISSMHFVEGSLSGRSRTWDEKGIRKSISEYKRGRKHGRFIFYGSSGIRKFEVNYVNGVKHGLYRTYNSAGTAVYEAVFEQGEKIAEKWITP